MKWQFSFSMHCSSHFLNLYHSWPWYSSQQLELQPGSWLQRRSHPWKVTKLWSKKHCFIKPKLDLAKCLLSPSLLPPQPSVTWSTTSIPLLLKNPPPPSPTSLCYLPSHFPSHLSLDHPPPHSLPLLTLPPSFP